MSAIASWRAPVLRRIRKAPEGWSIDSLRSPSGQPLAVYLRCAPVPKRSRAARSSGSTNASILLGA